MALWGCFSVVLADSLNHTHNLWFTQLNGIICIRRLESG
nr:MAG TPA: hypothetical protein [Caudoviricetes sp.]